MSYYENINFKIKGQTKKSNEKEIIRAKLNLVCAEHNLELEDNCKLEIEL